MPQEVKDESIELIAMMLIRLVRDQRAIEARAGVCDECR
jgi:hypothetical protein